MFMRSLCAFLLLASTASATISVTEDTTLTAGAPHEDYRVRNGALLTVDGADIRSVRVELGDLAILPGSSLDSLSLQGHQTIAAIEGGEIGPVSINASALSLSIAGGSFGPITSTEASTYTGEIEITGGLFRDGMSFGWSQEVSGNYHVSVRGGEWERELFIDGGQATATIYGRYFELSEGFAAHSGYWRTVRGILDNGQPFAATSWHNNDAFTVVAEFESRLPGDANADGSVDLDDMNLVRNSFGDSGVFVYGDTNFDNNVDLEDLNAVRNNFGASISRPAPEPQSLLLLTTGILASTLRWICFRRTSPHCHRQST